MCRECCNQSCLINYCTLDWIEKISSMKITPHYPKNQFIFFEGSPVMGAYFIKRGQVKIISSNINGKEHTVRLAKEGHILGHTAFGMEKYSIGAVTLSKSEICFIDNKTLKEAFLGNPKFTFEVMRFYSRELRKSEIRTKCLAMMNNEEKVVLGLLYIAETSNDHNSNQTKIYLSRREIAQIIGTNAEQVSRVISILRKNNLLDTKDRTIVLQDLEALKASLSHYGIAFEY